MIIVSQDKKRVMNFEKSDYLEILQENDYFYIGINFSNPYGEFFGIGMYKTEERAKEVLNAIGAYYGLCEIYKYGEQSDREKINNYAAERGIEPFIFPMPED